MKEITITLYELTQREAAELKDGTSVLIYNPIMNSYRMECISNSCLARSRFAASYIKYFVFNREGMKE